MKKVKYVLATSSLLFPTLSFGAFDRLKNLLTEIAIRLNGLITILFGLAIIFFFWGMGQFILHAGEEKARQEGRRKMVWGVIAIFVFLSIFGLIQLLNTTFGIPQDATNPNVSTWYWFPSA